MTKCLLAFGLILAAYSCSNVASRHPGHDTETNRSSKVVFRSVDGGQTWQDIGAGLPDSLRIDSLRVYNYFATENGFFLRVGNALYHTTPDDRSSSWTKELYPGDSSISPRKAGNYSWGVNLKKMDGTSVWSPIFENDQMPGLRSVFETEAGAVFIATNKGLIRTLDDGRTWQYVFVGDLVGNMAESNGVLLSTSNRNIIRSTDNGENWQVATSEDTVAWDVKPMNGGFAAITSVSESGSRRLSTSYDSGKTWQSVHSRLKDRVAINSIGESWNDRINDRLRARTSVTSVIKVGGALFCTHRDGVFKSSDNGKTWKLLLPTMGDRGFSLLGSGEVIYAVRTKGGC